jgi:hypothetical protein
VPLLDGKWSGRLTDTGLRRPGCRPRAQPSIWETHMAGKNKGGREARKPKLESNKKTKGQTPAAGSGQVAAVNRISTKK